MSLRNAQKHLVFPQGEKKKPPLFPYLNSTSNKVILMMVSENKAFYAAHFLGRASTFTCVFLTLLLLLEEKVNFKRYPSTIAICFHLAL